MDSATHLLSDWGPDKSLSSGLGKQIAKFTRQMSIHAVEMVFICPLFKLLGADLNNPFIYPDFKSAKLPSLRTKPIQLKALT